MFLSRVIGITLNIITTFQLTGQPKQILVKSRTAADRGADPVTIARTLPPSSFCILPKTRKSHIEDCVTMPLQKKKITSLLNAFVNFLLCKNPAKLNSQQTDLRADLSSIAFLLLKAAVKSLFFIQLDRAPCCTCKDQHWSVTKGTTWQGNIWTNYSDISPQLPYYKICGRKDTLIKWSRGK